MAPVCSRVFSTLRKSLYQIITMASCLMGLTTWCLLYHFPMSPVGVRVSPVWSMHGSAFSSIHGQPHPPMASSFTSIRGSGRSTNMAWLRLSINTAPVSLVSPVVRLCFPYQSDSSHWSVWGLSMASSSSSIRILSIHPASGPIRAAVGSSS